MKLKKRKVMKKGKMKRKNERNDILIIASFVTALRRVEFEESISSQLGRENLNLFFFYGGNTIGELEKIVLLNKFRGAIFDLNLSDRNLRTIKRQIERFVKNMGKEFFPTFLQVGATEVNGDVFPANSYAEAVDFLQGTTPLPNYNLYS